MRQRVGEILALQRLGEITVHPRPQAPLPVSLHRVRRQGDDRYVTARPPFAFADRGHGLEPVHLGHLHVHQDEVERPGLPGGHRLTSVADDGRRVPQGFQHAHRYFLVDGVVIGQKDAQAPRGPALALPDRDAGEGGPTPRRAGHRRRVQDPHQGVEQLGLPDGFDQRSGNSQVPRSIRFARGPPGGQHHQDEVSQLRLAPDPPGQGEPVHPGHHAVEQRHGEGRAACRRLAESRQRRRAAVDRRRSRPPVRQDFLQDAAVGLIVVHDQHGESRDPS